MFPRRFLLAWRFTEIYVCERFQSIGGAEVSFVSISFDFFCDTHIIHTWLNCRNTCVYDIMHRQTSRCSYDCPSSGAVTRAGVFFFMFSLQGEVVGGKEKHLLLLCLGKCSGCGLEVATAKIQLAVCTPHNYCWIHSKHSAVVIISHIWSMMLVTTLSIALRVVDTKRWLGACMFVCWLILRP